MPETWTPAETSTPVWTPAADDDLPFTSRGTLSSDAVTYDGDTLTEYLADNLTRRVGSFTADFDASGGSFTDVPQLDANAVPRAFYAGIDVLVIEGDSLGIWTVTASGPCTPGAALAPGDVIASESGRIAVAYTMDGTTVAGVTVHATADQFDVVEADVSEASELISAEAAGRLSTAPTFALCAPTIDGDHHDYAWEHDAPGDYTTGAWARFDDLIVLPMAEVAPSPTTERTYSEIATQTHDLATTTPPEDPGRWDNEEDAVERRWSTTNNAWRHSLFYEWTEQGGTEEAHSISTADTFDLVVGLAYTIVRHLEFNVGGNWRLRWFRRVWHETPTDTFDGADWVLIHTVNGTGTTSIDTGVADPWGYGYGQGSLYCRKITKRDAGPTGTLMANPDAATAAAGGDLTFTDGAGNEVVPGAEASTFTPGSGGGVSLGETSTTAYRGDRGKTAYDHSQSTTGNPHAVTAADVGAAPTSRTISAGTGLTGGGDLTADRTLAIDPAVSRRIPTAVKAASDLTRTGASDRSNDTELLFAAAANTWYRVEFHLTISGDASADVHIGVAAPAGSTMSVFMDYHGGAVSTASAITQQGAHLTTPGSGGAVSAGVIAAPGLATRVTGWVQTSSTAGDIALYWGPTSNGALTGVTRHAGSHLIHYTA